MNRGEKFIRHGVALSVQLSQTRLVALINPSPGCGQQCSALASSIELLAAALFSLN